MKNIINFILKQISTRQDLVLIVFMFVFILMFIVPVPPAVMDVLIAMNMSLTLLVLVTSTYLKGPADLSTFPALDPVHHRVSPLHYGSQRAPDPRRRACGRNYPDLRQFRRRRQCDDRHHRLLHHRHRAVHRGREGCGAHRRSRRALHARRAARQADEHRLRFAQRRHHQGRSEARRSRLEKESSFFGAMDGALRFVKGDAIANFVVIFVNLVGGLLVGMLTKGMSFHQAIHTFSILTVGEGLVSQIPAMFIAISAGIVATRVVDGRVAPSRRRYRAASFRRNRARFMSRRSFSALSACCQVSHISFSSFWRR